VAGIALVAIWAGVVGEGRKSYPQMKKMAADKEG